MRYERFQLSQFEVLAECINAVLEREFQLVKFCLKSREALRSKVRVLSKRWDLGRICKKKRDKEAVAWLLAVPPLSSTPLTNYFFQFLRSDTGIESS